LERDFGIQILKLILAFALTTSVCKVVLDCSICSSELQSQNCDNSIWTFVHNISLQALVSCKFVCLKLCFWTLEVCLTENLKFVGLIVCCFDCWKSVWKIATPTQTDFECQPAPPGPAACQNPPIDQPTPRILRDNSCFGKQLVDRLSASLICDSALEVCLPDCLIRIVDQFLQVCLPTCLPKFFAPKLFISLFFEIFSSKV
jgi:hypothetical protein